MSTVYIITDHAPEPVCVCDSRSAAEAERDYHECLGNPSVIREEP